MSKMWRTGWSMMAMTAVLALIGAAGCAHQEAQQNAAPTESLYERLGGEANIKAVVDEFVTLALDDAKVNFVREGTPKEFKATPENLDKLKMHMVQYLCKESGGPQTYEGKDMKEAHAGMGITLEQFNAAALDLRKAMDKCNVPTQEKEDLLTLVETTRWDIVEKK